MQYRSIVLAVSASSLLLAGGAALAQQHQHEEGSSAGQGPRGAAGMMGGGQGMMGMMQGCPMMQGMQGSRPHAMPQLPPGNEKLQLQMHAEIMQRVGEVLAKYAAQVK